MRWVHVVGPGGQKGKVSYTSPWLHPSLDSSVGTTVDCSVSSNLLVAGSSTAHKGCVFIFLLILLLYSILLLVLTSTKIKLITFLELDLNQWPSKFTALPTDLLRNGCAFKFTVSNWYCTMHTSYIASYTTLQYGARPDVCPLTQSYSCSQTNSYSDKGTISNMLNMTTSNSISWSSSYSNNTTLHYTHKIHVCDHLSYNWSINECQISATFVADILLLVILATSVKLLAIIFCVCQLCDNQSKYLL